MVCGRNWLQPFLEEITRQGLHLWVANQQNAGFSFRCRYGRPRVSRHNRVISVKQVSLAQDKGLYNLQNGAFLKSDSIVCGHFAGYVGKP